MSYDLSISIETCPVVTDDQELATLWIEQIGDDSFHKHIESAKFIAETPGVAPGCISLELDQRDGGRIEGMQIEAQMFLAAQSWVSDYSVNIIPTDEEIEEMIENIEHPTEEEAREMAEDAGVL